MKYLTLGACLELVPEAPPGRCPKHLGPGTWLYINMGALVGAIWDTNRNYLDFGAPEGVVYESSWAVVRSTRAQEPGYI